ncbi:MAG: flagellar protein FlgN [Proteobacteria bacterium]|nr:flagellar protein FlgN [Pseudomonadota bacterium]
MKELKELLKSQIKAHNELVSLLQKEREALILFQPEEIEKLAKEKDMVLMRIRLFEDERINLLNKLSEINDTKESITLSKLVELTGDEEFRDLGLKLVSLVQSVIELNEFNRILIERSSKHVNNFLHFFEHNAIETTKHKKILKI